MAWRAASLAKYSGVLLVLEKIELDASAAAGVALLRDAVVFAREREDAHARHAAGGRN